MSAAATPATTPQLLSLQRKLTLSAGFKTGNEKFSLTLNPGSAESWWNYKRLAIQIGLKNADAENVEEIAELLMEHEISHVQHTARNIDVKALPYPFALLNILEDARIEPKRRRNFGPLHRNSYRKCYLLSEDPSVFSNPANIGILLRWRRYGVETRTEKPAQLTEEQYQEFIEDWEYWIDRSIEAETTQAVSGHAQDLFEKWKELFESSKTDSSSCADGSIEGSPIQMGGEGEPAGDESGAGDSDGGGYNGSSTEIEEIEQFFSSEEPLFEWNMVLIEEQAALLRKILVLRDRSERVYTLSGRRFDPRRIEHPPLAPFKSRIDSKAVNSFKRLLVVLDGSGSMAGQPFRDAAHVAYILSLVFKVTLLITTTNSEKPIRVPLKHIDLLRRFSAWGGGENYVSVGEEPCNYSFSLWLTDAQVADRDVAYIERTNRIAKMGAGYVGEGSHSLEDVFSRNFWADSLNQSVGRMVGLFLKRNFTKMRAA